MGNKGSALEARGLWRDHSAARLLLRNTLSLEAPPGWREQGQPRGRYFPSPLLLELFLPQASPHPLGNLWVHRDTSFGHLRSSDCVLADAGGGGGWGSLLSSSRWAL